MYVRTHTYDTSATKKQRKKERKSDKNNNIWRNKSNKRKMKKKRERVRDVLPRSWQCRPKEKKEKSEKLPTKSLTFVSQEPPPWTLPPPSPRFSFPPLLFFISSPRDGNETIHHTRIRTDSRNARRAHCRVPGWAERRRGDRGKNEKKKKLIKRKKRSK